MCIESVQTHALKPSLSPSPSADNLKQKNLACSLAAHCVGLALLFLPAAASQAAPVLGTVSTSNLLTTDPLNGGITYGGTWGDDGIFDSTPVYSYNWHWNWITLGIAGYAYDHTFDDPDCNALGEWSPWNCPGISFNDTSSLVLNPPNGKSEWNSGTSSTTTPGTFISTFKARQTSMMRAQSGLIGTTTADYYMPKFSVTVPVTGTGLWKLDLKVTRNGIVQRNGAGSDYIIVRPLYTTVSGGVNPKLKCPLLCKAKMSAVPFTARMR